MQAVTPRPLETAAGGLSLPPEWVGLDKVRFPSFFLLGAAKSGTTSVHGYFAQHPDVCMSQPKEPVFFELEYHNGPAYYYNRYFSHWRGQPVVGESRHRNLYIPFVAARIHKHNPDARLIACLRNPAERAVSHWWHWFSRKDELLSLGDSLQLDLDRIRAAAWPLPSESPEDAARALFPTSHGFVRTYLDSGYYYDQVIRYLALFPRHQLHIILFDDLVRDSHAVMRELLSFVGASPEPAASFDYTRLNCSRQGMRAHVNDTVLKWLVEHYQPHNQRLAELIGRNLDCWNSPFETPMKT